MKNINYKALLLLGACLLGYTACEDTRNAHLEEFQTLFYFRNSGVQTLTLYKIGETSVYEIPICKGGRNLTSTGTVKVSVMDQSQLDIYNLANETNYAILPEAYYKFVSGQELAFGEDDRYRVAKVEMDTDRISELQQAAPDKTYVLGLQVYADNKVSDNGNLLILNPEIKIPALSFTNSDVLQYTYTSESPEKNEYTNKVELDMDNRWDFSCELGTCDEAWLNQYNEENGTSFELMPEAMYSLQPTAEFKNGSNRADFNVSIDRTKMSLMTEYALPVQITSCTKEQFALNGPGSTCMYVAQLIPDQVKFTEDMIESPFTHSGDDGQGIPGICDGDVDTYWQSEWGKNVTCDATYGIYIDFTLPEALSSIVVKYATRNSTYTSNIPQGIVIGVSNDKENWTVIGEVMSGLPVEPATWATLPVFSTETSFRYVRFGVATTLTNDLRTKQDAAVSTNLGEIEIYGANLVD